jgi:hypothetical protein
MEVVMYRTLFDVAGIAMLGWLLLILLPTWRVTRRIAESAIFPVFLCALYVVGIGAVLRELGPGLMGEFGSADGVLALLRVEGVALVAWIHILAFDQLVGVLIYRDNMTHRHVPIPVQSVMLVATLMLGPVGFLSYWAVRTVRRRDVRVAWGERGTDAPRPAASTAVVAPRFQAVVTGSTLLARSIGLWGRYPFLTVVGMLGFAFAAVTTAVAAWNGGWLMSPEGRLLEAVKFSVAVGIYTLTLGLILPLAPMTDSGRRRWAGWAVGLTTYGYLMENVQAWRGLNPRFSAVAGPLDQALGGVFFLQALGLLVLFVILMRRFFRDDALPDHPALRLSLRYATAGVLIAFGVGILMSGIAGRVFRAGGDLMPIHAAGFHALQAVPLIALLISAGALRTSAVLRMTHIGGAGWLLLCVGMVVQALMGMPPAAPTPALAISAVGATMWTSALGIALHAWATAERSAWQPVWDGVRAGAPPVTAGVEEEPGDLQDYGRTGRDW